MKIAWIDPAAAPESLPDPSTALRVPDGLLAAGGDLSPAWLLHAYSHGVFPWYEEGQPVLWWSPDPRAVLWPQDLKVSRSLARTIRKGVFRCSADRAFGDVVAACAGPRANQSGTWITNDMRAAYTRLHRLGHAHSVEVWREDELVGGLYGVAIGRVFFGESMFTRVSDASKTGFVWLVERLAAWGYRLIDCQQATQHLARLGSREMPRAEFLARLEVYCDERPSPESWDVAS